LDISDKVVLGGIECFQSFILQSDAAEEKKVDWEEKVFDLYLPLHQKSFFFIDRCLLADFVRQWQTL
jgi:hypothetical protein